MQEAPALTHRRAAFSPLPRAVQTASLSALSRKQLQQVAASISALAPRSPVGPRPGWGVCLPPRGAWRRGRPSAASAAGSPWLRTRPVWCWTRPPASLPRREPPPGSRCQGRHLPLLPHPRSAASWTSSYLQRRTRK